MKAKKERQSRNRQRKALYAALGNSGSRNQIPIEKPIVGRFEMRPVTCPCPRCFDAVDLPCHICSGTRKITVYDQSGRVVERRIIVHEE